MSLNRSFSHRIDGNTEQKQLNQAAFYDCSKGPKETTRCAGWSEPSLNVRPCNILKSHELALMCKKNHNQKNQYTIQVTR